jgi:hypothetical protein
MKNLRDAEKIDDSADAPFAAGQKLKLISPAQ